MRWAILAQILSMDFPFKNRCRFGNVRGRVAITATTFASHVPKSLICHKDWGCLPDANSIPIKRGLFGQSQKNFQAPSPGIRIQVIDRGHWLMIKMKSQKEYFKCRKVLVVEVADEFYHAPLASRSRLTQE
jgi:hypothetical protein